MIYINPKEWVVVIPTYQRYTELGAKTLETLERQRVPKSRIYIFVANKKEAQEYANLYGNDYKIVVGKKGLIPQLEFIVRYFPEGQPIVRCDDDVTQIWEKTGEHSCRQLDLVKFIPEAFECTKEHGLSIWGVTPITNPFLAKDNITTDPRLIIGQFMGWFNRRGKNYKYSYREDMVEDIEKTIIYHRNDNGIIRFNFIGIDSEYNAPGGLNTAQPKTERQRSNETKKHLRALIQYYPAYKPFLLKDIRKYD